MELSTVFIAISLALLSTAAIFLVGFMLNNFSMRRLRRRFAELKCESCQQPFGLRAIETADDVSPFEEVWVDEDGGDICYCSPICLSVVCSACQRTWTLRYNTQGERFGPVFSVNDPDKPEDFEVWKFDSDQSDDETK